MLISRRYTARFTAHFSSCVCEQSAKLGDEFLTGRGAVGLGELEFAALERIVERRDPGYRH